MNTFKKTLIAATLASVASASFGAALLQTGTDLVATGVTKSTPSIQAVATADKVSVDGPVLVLGANYGVGDTITATYSGAAFDSAFSFPTGAITTVQATDTTANAAARAQCDAATVSFAGLVGSTATFTVGSTTGNTIDCTIKLPDVEVDGASLAATDKLSVAISTSRGYGTLESVAATVLADVGLAEITATVTAGADKTFDQQVDVNKDRYEFTANTDDVAEIVIADPANGAALEATSLVTITGDFGWAGVSSTNNAGVTTVAYGATEMGVAGPDNTSLGTIVRNATTFSFVAKKKGTYTVTLTPQAKTKKMTLPAGDFSVTTRLDYKNGVDNTIHSDSSTAALGSWTLNGASITAHGISNSPSVTPMIWIQNGGSSNGGISGSVYCNGNTITIANLGTAAAYANTKVGEAIQAAVDAAGTCSTVNTRYDATVTVNGPKDDITMNASYKVTAADGATDRVMLETSDSLPSSSNTAN